MPGFDGGALNIVRIGGVDIKVPFGFAVGGIGSIWDLIRFFITFLLSLGVIASLLFLLIGGIRWIMSGGDKEAMAKAKGTVTYALVGLVLLLGSFIILSVIQTIFSLSLGIPLVP